MIVIQRNGETTVITGWRAWLIGAVALVLTTVLIGLMRSCCSAWRSRSARC